MVPNSDIGHGASIPIMDKQSTKQPTFASWAPEAAKEAWHTYNRQPNVISRETSLMLLMLLNDDRMKDAWEHVKQASSSQGNDEKQIDAELFCLASDCIHGYSTIKRKLKLTDIRAAALRLVCLIEDTPLEDIHLLKFDNEFIDNYQKDVHQRALEVSDTDDLSSLYRTPAMSEHALSLKEFLGSIERWASSFDSSEATASHPLYGPRNHFVRHLNKKLQERYKKSMLEFIIPAHNVVFCEDINNKKFQELDEQSFYQIIKKPKN